MSEEKSARESMPEESAVQDNAVQDNLEQDTAGQYKILFVCTGNSARSQMGEAFVRLHAGDMFEAHSAGLSPSEVNPYTIKVMEEIGYDMSGHVSSNVEEYLGQEDFDYVVTVCSRAERECSSAFFWESCRMHWPFDDPAAFEGSEEATMGYFRMIRNQINRKVQTWLAGLEQKSA